MFCLFTSWQRDSCEQSLYGSWKHISSLCKVGSYSLSWLCFLSVSSAVTAFGFHFYLAIIYPDWLLLHYLSDKFWEFPELSLGLLAFLVMYHFPGWSSLWLHGPCQLPYLLESFKSISCDCLSLLWFTPSLMCVSHEVLTDTPLLISPGSSLSYHTCNGRVFTATVLDVPLNPDHCHFWTRLQIPNAFLHSNSYASWIYSFL